MSGMSRRDLLRASAGAAAVAVPMSVLSSRGVGASRDPESAEAATAAGAAAAATTGSLDVGSYDVSGPVMFCVLDARVGEVSILHGDAEVIVRDRQLVDRIMRAAQRVTV
jgi:TAT (twin-arginine translocation) pathway signal sequence